MADFTQADLDALNDAIKSGVNDVYYGDKRVSYRSIDEMIRVRDLMRRDLGLSTGGYVKTEFKKGI